MTCPRCGGNNIVIEGCEIYCLSPSNSFITSKCFYHFDGKERAEFKKFIKVEYAKKYGLKYETVRGAYSSEVKLLYIPDNMELDKKDQHEAKQQQKFMNQAKCKANEEYQAKQRELSKNWYHRNKDKRTKWREENKEQLNKKERERYHKNKLGC